MSWQAVPVKMTGDILTAANWNAVADNMADSGWLNPASFLNSWGPQSGSNVAYRLIGNRVQLRGQVTGGSTGTTAYALPVGYRPQQDVLIPSANASAIGDVEVYTTGGVLINLNGGSNPASLDSVSFYTD